MSTLGAIARAALEADMTVGEYEYKSDFALEFIAKGREEGREAGRVEEAQRLLLAILAERGLGPSDAMKARVAGCGDAALLERWVVKASTAQTEDAVFTG